MMVEWMSVRDEAKRNSKKIDSIRMYTAKPEFDSNIYGINEEYAKSESFSIRMIVVMLILSAMMFVKQTDLLEGNEAYQSVMAEIHRQVTVEEVKDVFLNQ